MKRFFIELDLYYKTFYGRNFDFRNKLECFSLARLSILV